jgi:hypothetical protein
LERISGTRASGRLEKQIKMGCAIAREDDARVIGKLHDAMSEAVATDIEADVDRRRPCEVAIDGPCRVEAEIRADSHARQVRYGCQSGRFALYAPSELCVEREVQRAFERDVLDRVCAVSGVPDGELEVAALEPCP